MAQALGLYRPPRKDPATFLLEITSSPAGQHRYTTPIKDGGAGGADILGASAASDALTAAAVAAAAAVGVSTAGEAPAAVEQDAAAVAAAAAAARQTRNNGELWVKGTGVASYPVTFDEEEDHEVYGTAGVETPQLQQAQQIEASEPGRGLQRLQSHKLWEVPNAPPPAEAPVPLDRGSASSSATAELATTNAGATAPPSPQVNDHPTEPQQSFTDTTVASSEASSEAPFAIANAWSFTKVTEGPASKSGDAAGSSPATGAVPRTMYRRQLSEVSAPYSCPSGGERVGSSLKDWVVTPEEMADAWRGSKWAKFMAWQMGVEHTEEDM